MPTSCWCPPSPPPAPSRLHAEVALEVVLVHPRIPANTGSIGRLCAATETRLRVVKPLFRFDDALIKRAGLDYWPHLDLVVEEDWRAALADAPCWLFTVGAQRLYTDVTYGPNDRLVFGREDIGLEPEILAAYPDRHVGIPMQSAHVRSLNLAQCVAVGVYEAWRQLGRRGMQPTETPQQTSAQWWAQVEPELAGADAAWLGGNAGKGRVGSRRAAGMAIKAWLALHPQDHYGKNFMHHLNALADDDGVEVAIREAAWRLAARPRPEGDFQVPVAPRLTPQDDARLIIAWCQARLG